jgi:hypothetical protein
VIRVYAEHFVTKIVKSKVKTLLVNLYPKLFV